MIPGAIGRCVVVIALALGLGGCSTIIGQHLEASRALADACRTLSSEPPPFSISSQEYWAALQARVWPTLPACVTTLTDLPPIPAGTSPGSGVTTGTPPASAGIHAKDAAQASLLACSLHEQVLPLTGRTLDGKFDEIRRKLQAVEQKVGAATQKWEGLSKTLPGRINAADRKRAWLTEDTTLYRSWKDFDASLVEVAEAVDELEAAVRAANLSPLMDSVRADMVTFTTNSRAMLRKARLAMLDESVLLREFVKGQVVENFSKQYLLFVDRSLNPLEKSFNRFDEKAYGLGALALTGIEGLVQPALKDFTASFVKKLCGGTSCADASRFVQAIGREACKQAGSQSLENVRSPMMMHYVYRFHAWAAVKKWDLGKEKLAGNDRDHDVRGPATMGAPADSAVVSGFSTEFGSQLLQHALAEWSVRGEWVGQDARSQLRGQRSGSGSVWASISLALPKESAVESLAMEQATNQIVEAWDATRGHPSPELAFVQQMHTQNNLSVSQHVAVQVVNQQTVVNNILVEAGTSGLPTTSVRFEPAVIQLALPPTLAEPTRPRYCEGAPAGKCSELVDGFRWRTGPFVKGKAEIPKEVVPEIASVADLMQRVRERHPGRAVQVEVHGFASGERYECRAFRPATRTTLRTNFTSYAPACAGLDNANPRLSFDRALHVLQDLDRRAGSDRVRFAAPIPHGDFEPGSDRRVEIRVFAAP